LAAKLGYKRPMHPTASLVVSIAVSLYACKKDKTPDRDPPPRPSQPAPVRGLDADAIGKAAGTEATTTSDGVVRIGWGRGDVPVKVDGAPFPPSAGLGSWAAFAAVEGGAMVMGDTVVFQDEITPAIDGAFAAGLHVTALHNHFVFDDPPVFFMHIGGKGDPLELAAGVKSMWDAIKAVRAGNPTPATAFDDAQVKPGKLDREALGAIIGHDAADKPGGVVKVVIERRASMHGAEFGGSMGLTTWVAFAGDDKLASIDGDFAMTTAEVQPVLRALRAAKIHVVALHNHMIGETPAYFFVHFWGKGSAADLARGFRAALDAQARAGTE
jgi:hypothetical protein